MTPRRKDSPTAPQEGAIARPPPRAKVIGAAERVEIRRSDALPRIGREDAPTTDLIRRSKALDPGPLTLADVHADAGVIREPLHPAVGVLRRIYMNASALKWNLRSWKPGGHASIRWCSNSSAWPNFGPSYFGSYQGPCSSGRAFRSRRRAAPTAVLRSSPRSRARVTLTTRFGRYKRARARRRRSSILSQSSRRRSRRCSAPPWLYGYGSDSSRKGFLRGDQRC